MKSLVLYYSLSGNTEKYAKDIADQLHADLLEIKLHKPMPDAKWKQMLFGGKQAVFNEKPGIEDLPETISEYDEIILGTPIWAGKPASPVNTVLTDPKIAEKVVAVFTLSASGNNTKCAKLLREKLPGLHTVISLKGPADKHADENSSKVKQLLKRITNG